MTPINIGVPTGGFLCKLLCGAFCAMSCTLGCGVVCLLDGPFPFADVGAVVVAVIAGPAATIGVTSIASWI